MDVQDGEMPGVYQNSKGVRIIVLNLPEDEGEGLGFRLTRTLWDPYPWVREVIAESRADAAGLKMGDCILQADGKDLLGMPVGQVAGLIRGDGGGRGVTLLVWNCGVDPSDDPELLWSCGGGLRGEKARRTLAAVVRALSCCVCLATVTAPLCCTRSHLYCLSCWSRLERCALCRETLPSKDSPYARNLVAEQVFEAIATEYEIKTVKRRTETASAYASPNRSPNMSPSTHRRGQYQLSMMKKHVQFDRYGHNYASDPNIHSSFNSERCTLQGNLNCPKLFDKRQASTSKLVETVRFLDERQATKATYQNTAININANIQNSELKATNTENANLVENVNENSTKSEDNPADGNCKCHCQSPQMQKANLPQIKVDGCELVIPHKVVATLRQACSMADLQNVPCSITKANKNTGECLFCKGHGHHSSLDSLKTQCNPCDPPVFLVTAPPIYVVTCENNHK